MMAFLSEAEAATPSNSAVVIVMCVVMGLIAIAGVVVLVILILRNKNNKAKNPSNGLQARYDGATVFSKRAVNYGDSISYFATFYCGTKVLPELEVPEDAYNDITIGQSGTLLTENGLFYGFGAN